MTDLSVFPIAKRWPAQHPDRLQLYSLPTPNGVKVSIMLEEIGLPYEAHLVDFSKGEQRTPEYLSLNPYGKIPAIIDPVGPGGKPLPLFESGAILLYLAEKTGKLLPADRAARYETLQWLFFQIGAMGPMFGQVGFFTNSPAARSRTSARCTVIATRPSAFSQSSRRDSLSEPGSWATNTRSPTFRCLAGCAISSAFTTRASWSASLSCSTSPPGSSAALPGPPFSGGSMCRRAGSSSPELPRSRR
jgi:glutathione S-transferase